MRRSRFTEEQIARALERGDVVVVPPGDHCEVTNL